MKDGHMKPLSIVNLRMSGTQQQLHVNNKITPPTVS